MNSTWIARRFSMADLPQRLQDDAGVLSAETLGVVRDASGLVAATRARCAQHLRRSRSRHRMGLLRQRQRLEAHVLAEVASLMRALQEERTALREAAGQLATDLARLALERLMVDVPSSWPSQSSVRLALAEWEALELKDEAVVHVHPEDVPALAAAEAGAGWRLLPDNALARGDCLLVHSSGTVQASFNSNVAAMLAALRRTLERQPRLTGSPTPECEASGPSVPQTS